MSYIEELIQKRKKLADAITENDADLSTVLVGLYADPSHFIYEILQNSEDCGATEISFKLEEDKLFITHDGAFFDEKDIEAITGIALKENVKKERLDKIGKFGIGFKSVYAITSTPRIQSGKYDFTIKNFVLPENFTDSNSYNDTRITLLFDRTDNSKDEIYEMIKNKFESFENYNLLFLSTLNKISFIREKEKIQISKQQSPYIKNRFAFKINFSGKGLNSKYLVFREPVKHPDFQNLKKKQYCEVAFQLDETDEFVKSQSSNLFVFFETGFETFLNFMLQAPFLTTAARDNISLTNPLNAALINELCELIKNSLIFLSENKLINLNLLLQLPLNNKIDKSKSFYWNIFNAIKKELSSDKEYFPILNNKALKPASEVALLRGRELTSVISSVEELQELFGKKYWLDSNITEVRTKELWDYLRYELYIPEIPPIEFVRKITKEFLEKKDDIWFSKLYEFLNSGQESLWRTGKGSSEGPLRRKPFIRLVDGSIKQPFDTLGKPVVFLSINGKLNYDTVKPETIKSKSAKEFIKDKLGIREPYILDEIKFHIVPKYMDENKLPSFEEHLEHIEVILNYYSSSAESVRAEVIKNLTDQKPRFFVSQSSQKEESLYKCFNNVYFPDEKLINYFKYTDGIYYLNLEFYSKLPQDKLKSLFRACYIRDYPHIFKIEPKFEPTTKSQLRQNSYYRDSNITREICIYDYKLAGLNKILEQKPFTFEHSKLVWELITKCLSNPNYKNPFVMGEYKWVYYYERTTTFQSQIIRKLQNASWLFSKHDLDNPLKPSEVSVFELSEEYNISTEEAKYLINHLEFKSEVMSELISKLPEEEKADFQKMEKLLNISKEKGINFDEVYNRVLAQLNIIDIKDEINEAPELSSVTPIEIPFEEFDNSGINVTENDDDNEEQDNGGDGEKEKPTKTVTVLSQEDKDTLGLRGEKIVFGDYLKNKYLKSKYTLVEETENVIKLINGKDSQIEIIHLNSENRKKVAGCDIIVKKDDEIIEYIEVKSTKNEDKELFKISGYQWEFAHKLYDEGKGNMYKIIVVKKVLNHQPPITEIINPIKKWKDGTLYAHPINFKL